MDRLTEMKSLITDMADVLSRHSSAEAHDLVERAKIATAEPGVTISVVDMEDSDFIKAIREANINPLGV